MRTALILLTGCLCLAGGAAARAQTPSDPAPIRTTPFPDVPQSHWAFDAVEQLRKAGILRGYPPQPAPAKKPPARRPGRTRVRRA